MNALNFAIFAICCLMACGIYYVKRRADDAAEDATDAPIMTLASQNELVELAPAPIVKLALCCERLEMPATYNAESQLRLHDLPVNFFQQLPVFMADRADCETDEKLLQLLPYVVAYSQATKRIFMYGRGGSGGEGRLIGKLSVGLGGHVDSLPPPDFSLRRWLVREAQREVLEEVGAHVSLLQFGVLGLLNDPTDAVGRVHLGILMLVRISEDDIVGAEADVIDNGQWRELDELKQPDTFQRMENWSKLAIMELGKFL